MKKILKKSTLPLMLILPNVVFGQYPLPPTDFKSFVDIVVGIIDLAIPVITGLIFIVFLWGLSLFILKSDNEEKRKQGVQLMIWGIIGIFLTFSLWTILYILTGSFGFPLVTPQLKVAP